MRIIACSGALFILFTLGAASVHAQDEVGRLEAYAHDEPALIGAARRLDRRQKQLIDWDLKLIDQYMKAGDTDLALSKQNDLRGRVEVVRDTWEFVMERYPNNAQANNYYGEYLYDYGNNKLEAVKRWRAAVNLDNKFAPAHNNLGIHYFHHGEYSDGLRHLDRAVDLDEDNPDFLFNLTQMYLNYFPQIQEIKKISKEKTYREAMRMSKRAADNAAEDYDLLEDYAVNFFAAENFGIEPDWGEAAAAWKVARAQAPNEIKRFYGLLNEGRCWLRAGDAEKAVGPLEEAQAMRPQSDPVRNLLEQARRG